MIVASTRSAIRTSGIDGGRRSCAVNISVSRTVESAKSASCCSTYAEILGIAAVRSCPLSSTLPVSDVSFAPGTRQARYIEQARLATA